MTKMLRPVGFYSDTESGVPGQPLLSASCNKFSGATVEVVSYLKTAFHMLVSGSPVHDELDRTKPIIGALGSQADGVWFWPTTYPYYVERYRVEVPVELLELAQLRNWIPPEFSEDANFEDRVPFL
ncbi:hypothetical protein [Streptomyces sp. NBC_01462]|uniref:hypothetical protein n=1 Tax=Streptomyces sp. NBC_01462 TaxID=2903876 RepID=UPI002E303631|nr:hypothetical protein [Streptomyces sp. NBC_01462]